MRTKTLGWAAVVMAGSILFFVIMFAAVYPAAGISGGDLASGEVFLPFAHDNLILAVTPYGVGILMHLAGVVLVIGLWSQLRDRSVWVSVAAGLGVMWMAFDIAYNGIAIHLIPQLAESASDPVVATMYEGLAASLGALQLTGHLAGGLWLSITTYAGVESGRLSRALGWFGVGVGVVFAVSILGPNVLYPSFVFLPVWFGWFGVGALRSSSLVPMVATTVEV